MSKRFVYHSVIKVGKNFAFASTEAIDTNTGELICFGRHAKYVPLNFFQAFALKNAMPLIMKSFEILAEQGLRRRKERDDGKSEVADKKFTTLDSILSISESDNMDEKSSIFGTFRIDEIHRNMLGTLHVSEN